MGGGLRFDARDGFTLTPDTEPGVIAARHRDDVLAARLVLSPGWTVGKISEYTILPAGIVRRHLLAAGFEATD